MKKKAIIIASAIIIGVTLLSIVAYATLNKIGDANGDGKVSVADAKWILQNIAGTREFTPEQKKAADVNGDGKVTVVDAKWTLEQVAGTRDENFSTTATTTTTTTKPATTTTTTTTTKPATTVANTTVTTPPGFTEGGAYPVPIDPHDPSTWPTEPETTTKARKGPTPTNETGAKCPYKLGVWTTRDGYEGYYATDTYPGVAAGRQLEREHLINGIDTQSPDFYKYYDGVAVSVGTYNDVGEVFFLWFLKK